MKDETEKLVQCLNRAASPEAKRQVFCQLLERYRGAAIPTLPMPPTAFSPTQEQAGELPIGKSQRNR